VTTIREVGGDRGEDVVGSLCVDLGRRVPRADLSLGACQVRAADAVGDRVRERDDVAGGYHDTGAPGQHVGDARDVAAHHGAANCEGLKHGQRQTLPAGRQHDQVGGGVPRPGIVDRAGEEHSGRRVPAQWFKQIARTDNSQRRPGASCAHRRPRGEQQVLPLLPGHSADTHGKRRVGREVQQRPRDAPVTLVRALEALQVHAAAHHAVPAP